MELPKKVRRRTIGFDQFLSSETRSCSKKAESRRCGTPGGFTLNEISIPFGVTDERNEVPFQNGIRFCSTHHALTHCQSVATVKTQKQKTGES